jgi:hypothetical protein
VSDLFFRVFEQDHPLYQAWVGSLMQAFAAQTGKRVFLTSAAYRTVPPPDIVIGSLDVAANAEGVFYYNLRHICDRPANLEGIQHVSQAAQAVFDGLPGAQPDAWAAIILPKYLWQDHYYKDSLHLLHESIGMYQCLTLAGVPAKILFESQLSDLDRYGLVVIPELYSVPAELAGTLEKYVRSGGVLWMSLQSTQGPRCQGETSLWDMFGVTYKGQTPPMRSLHSQDALVSLPVYDWPVVQHQLFGGFPTVSHQRAHLEPAPHSRILLSGSDNGGREYPLVVETELGAGTGIFSAEAFGATFNSYMQKCAGHASIWLARAMALRNFLQQVVLRTVGQRLPATVETRGNVATFWWKGDAGRAAWLVNHEYSDRQTVLLRLAPPGEEVYTQVLFAEKVRESRQGDTISIEVEVEPSSIAVVIAK